MEGGLLALTVMEQTGNAKALSMLRKHLEIPFTQIQQALQTQRPVLQVNYLDNPEAMPHFCALAEALTALGIPVSTTLEDEVIPLETVYHLMDSHAQILRQIEEEDDIHRK